MSLSLLPLYPHRALRIRGRYSYQSSSFLACLTSVNWPPHTSRPSRAVLRCSKSFYPTSPLCVGSATAKDTILLNTYMVLPILSTSNYGLPMILCLGKIKVQTSMPCVYWLQAKLSRSKWMSRGWCAIIFSRDDSSEVLNSWDLKGLYILLFFSCCFFFNSLSSLLALVRAVPLCAFWIVVPSIELILVLSVPTLIYLIFVVVNDFSLSFSLSS